MLLVAPIVVFSLLFSLLVNLFGSEGSMVWLDTRLDVLEFQAPDLNLNSLNLAVGLNQEDSLCVSCC